MTRLHLSAILTVFVLSATVFSVQKPMPGAGQYAYQLVENWPTGTPNGEAVGGSSAVTTDDLSHYPHKYAKKR